MSWFPPWEAAGDKIRKWMENASEPGCPIPRTTLTLETLPNRSGWDVTIDSDIDWLESEHHEYLRRVGISAEGKTNGHYAYNGVIVKKSTEPVTVWTGLTGPGVIFIGNIDRAAHSDGPYISELTKAIYENDQKLEGLKHVWVFDVKNEDTLMFIKGHIYTQGMEFQYPPDAIITWTSGDPQFNALLGTSLGKVVGYFILGAFGQGAKRVARVSLFQTFFFPQLQFDIEDV